MRRLDWKVGDWPLTTKGIVPVDAESGEEIDDVIEASVECKVEAIPTLTVRVLLVDQDAKQRAEALLKAERKLPDTEAPS